MPCWVFFYFFLAIVSSILSLDTGTTTSFTITCHTNETGHRITKVRVVDSSSCDGRLQTQPWQMDVDQGEKCSGQKSKYLQVTLTAQPKPAEDYEFFPLVGHYKLHSTAQTWREAFNICQQEGAHLAVINSDTEAEVLKNLFNRGTKIEGAEYGGSAFVGVNDIVTEGKFVTIFGEDIEKTGFSKWGKNEPNNGGGTGTDPGQDCGSLVQESGLLDDAKCNIKLPFFCEQEF